MWWTEFGYDTYDKSILRAPALGKNSSFIVQGQWLVRAFLAALAAGIDRATLFELEIARPNRANGIYAYIRRGDRVVPIDGRSAQIHAQNGTAPARLDTMARAMEYLRFFMAAVQSAEGGTFRLVDESRDVPWLSTATDQDRNSVAGQIYPASISPSSSGGWQAVVSAQHGNAVFRATMWVKPNGEVDMLKDEPIGSGLPIALERFDDQGLRVRVSN